jgi:AmpD protein
MRIDIKTGLVSQATYFHSPNFNDRPEGTLIDLLVIHGISLPPGRFGGKYVHAFFSNQLDTNEDPYFQEIAHLKVSSHFFISREGHLWQFVPLHKRAWHAGQSFFQGKENCNDFSIGIELEGTDEIPYTLEQYQCLAEVTALLLQTYPALNFDRIVGHSDVAPGRKSDPGAVFDWKYYRNRVKILLEDKQIT